jgi:sec-independent protein translocase protein TatA
MNFPVFTLAFIEGLGGPEMLLILVIILMLFGKDKLPELARGLGKSMKELKKATSNVEEEFKRALQEDEYRQNQASYTPAITSAQPVAALAAHQVQAHQREAPVAHLGLDPLRHGGLIEAGGQQVRLCDEQQNGVGADCVAQARQE